MKFLPLLLPLFGCVMPPTATEGAPSNLNYTICLFWASCGVDAGSAGDTMKEGGATLTPLRSYDTEFPFDPVPAVPVEPVEPVG